MVKKQQLNETGNETIPVRVCGPLQAKGLRQVSDRSPTDLNIVSFCGAISESFRL
jgi:hypothetical protein